MIILITPSYADSMYETSHQRKENNLLTVANPTLEYQSMP